MSFLDQNFPRLTPADILSGDGEPLVPPAVVEESPAVEQTDHVSSSSRWTQDLAQDKASSPTTAVASQRWMSKRKRRLLEEQRVQQEKQETRTRNLALIGSRWPHTKTVVVSNTKGGSGKTPVSILLASTFGSLGGFPPVLVDNDFTGDSARRVEEPPRLVREDMVADLVNLLDSQTPHSHIRAYTAHQTSGNYDVLAAPKNRLTVNPDTGERDLLGLPPAQEFLGIANVLSRVYSLIIADSGNTLAEPSASAALSTADVLVIPVKWTKDDCEAAKDMLYDLSEIPRFQHLAQTAIIVHTSNDEHVEHSRADEYKAFFASGADGLTVVDVPADPMIAQNEKIMYTSLQEATREAGIILAAEVARRFSTSRP